MTTVLFACVHNAGRSQMAAAWFNRLADPAKAAILSLILAPLVAILIQFAISRTREFQADKSGAEITGQPLQLASALQKISAGTSRIPMRVNEATSQLFIDNPLRAVRGRGMSKWFSTHPPVEERIQRLQDMAMGVG